MRRTTLGMLVVVVAVAGCGGSGAHFQNRDRPATPVNLTVYITDQKVSVSPSSVGAGPVLFVITNQSSKAQALAVTPAASSGPATANAGSSCPPSAAACTGPISPQGTAQLTVDLNSPGNYSVGIAPSSSNEAAAATPTGVTPAVIHIGKSRPSSNNQLLQP